jgi:hypothetical protein
MAKEKKPVKKPRKSKKITHLNLWCQSDHGIELMKIPAEYSKDFITRFGVLRIPERKDLLDWLYEEKNWVYKKPKSPKK